MMSSLLIVVSLLFQFSCRTARNLPSDRSPGSLENVEVQNTKSEIPTHISPDIFSRDLANGWDSEFQRKLSPCLEVDFVYRGAQSSDLKFMRDFTYEQIMKETGAGLYGKANLFGLVSAKIQGDMALALASTEDSTSFIYNFNILGKSALLRERRFNSKGSITYSKNDLAHFREHCGDQFIEQVKLGGQLYIGVKYTFASEETKEKINLGVSLSLFWGLIKVSKTWSKEFRDLMKDVRISIEAFQVGGDPIQLAALKNSILTGSCAGDEPELCVTAVDRLLEYGSKDFAEQLQDMQRSERAGEGPAIIDVVIADYRSLKIYDPLLERSVLVNVTASKSRENSLKVGLETLENWNVRLRISQGRVKILAEFPLSEDDRVSVESTNRKITETLMAIDDLKTTSCKRAETSSEFLKPCLESIEKIEFMGRDAVVPVNLSRPSVNEVE